VDVVVDCGGAIVVLVAECVLLTTVAGAAAVVLVSVDEVDAAPPPTEVVELLTAVPVPSELTEVLLLTSSAKAGRRDTRTVAANVTPSVFEFNIIFSLNEPNDHMFSRSHVRTRCYLAEFPSKFEKQLFETIDR
jgi:hypothetical protein